MRTLRGAKSAISGLRVLPQLARLEAHIEYLDRELARLNAAQRRTAWQSARRTGLEAQTKASFDFQWQHLPTGSALPSDPAFMSALEHELPDMVGVPREWFAGKRAFDVGCGVGRYSYGLLQLGARVTACDQSETALQRTATLCQPFADRLRLEQIDLLEWSDSSDADLGFCYGVVHHTGNTYLAIDNVCRKVAVGGRVFFMIYAGPDTRPALQEVNLYEQLAADVRDLTFEERQTFLTERFGTDKAHGWFDAVSPRINDRLTFEEVHDLLTELGFGRISGSRVLRNHYITAERVRAA